MNPVYNKWYMDDGGIIGDVELLAKVWDLIKSRGPELGLHLNPSNASGVGWTLHALSHAPSDLMEYLKQTK